MTVTFVELLQRQLLLKSAWTRALEASETGHDEESFNSADIVALGLVAHVFRARCVVVADPKLFALLDLATRDAACEGIFEVVDSFEKAPDKDFFITLMPRGQWRSGAGNGVKELVLVHGWRSPFAPSEWDPGDWPRGRILVPICTSAPSLWRTGLQILATRESLAEINALLNEVKSIFNDKELDLFYLLETIQTLKQALRRDKSQAGREAPRPAALDSDERIISLEQELAAFKRTAMLQQTALATVYNRILKKDSQG